MQSVATALNNRVVLNTAAGLDTALSSVAKVYFKTEWEGYIYIFLCLS